MKPKTGLMIAMLLWLFPSHTLSQLTVPPTRYRVVALGTLGGKSSTAYALNNRGQVVGQSEDNKGKKRAFLWEKGKMRALNLPSVKSSLASDINEARQVVCVLTPPGGKSAQIALLQKGKTQIILTEPKSNIGYTQALINNRGMIAGMSETAAGTRRIFTWQKGKLTNIKIDPAYTFVSLRALNDSGQIACRADRIDRDGFVLNQPACLIEAGRLRVLEGIGGYISDACGINDKEQIVGKVSDPYVTPARFDAFLWKRGNLTVLKSPSYNGWWIPRSINNQGQIVGEGMIGAALALFLWQDGKLYQLNDLLPLKGDWKVDGDQMSLNDRGEILVHLERKEQRRAYLLIPAGS